MAVCVCERDSDKLAHCAINYLFCNVASVERRDTEQREWSGRSSGHHHSQPSPKDPRCILPPCLLDSLYIWLIQDWALFFHDDTQNKKHPSWQIFNLPREHSETPTLFEWLGKYNVSVPQEKTVFSSFTK